jgi:hypothetical protein
VERTFTLDKRERALVVVDRIGGGELPGSHLVQVRLQLPDRNARLRAPTAEERERAARARGHRGELGDRAVQLGNRAVALFSAGLALELEPATYSPGYGEVTRARAVVASRHAKLPVLVEMVVLFL